MKRRVLAITGTRADYGLMRPVYREIISSESLDLQLVVTGMHLLQDFRAGLDEIHNDSYCKIHRVSMLLAEDSGLAMAKALGLGIFGIASVIGAVSPDIVLLQGDRGEMLAGAIVAAHMNIPIVHMSGGDTTGTIDESIRQAITQFSHVHLTTCARSTQRLLQQGESSKRIFEVGEPGLDAIRTMDFETPESIAAALGINPQLPILLATMHPVTTEASDAATQMSNVLQALDQLSFQTVFTYPNSDAGGREMKEELESYKGRPWLRIVPHLGSRRYLSLMRIASALVGNSSSGILEAPSFRLPAVNIGTRQHGRLQASNVIDVGYDVEEIGAGIRYALEDEVFKQGLDACQNPYGDGFTARKTVHILEKLRLVPSLVAKWMPAEQFVPAGWDGI
jgi:GDP/UDP-N,N'-diacetylbacillosamine 2-epimerase (hydrolysing)